MDKWQKMQRANSISGNISIYILTGISLILSIYTAFAYGVKYWNYSKTGIINFITIAIISIFVIIFSVKKQKTPLLLIIIYCVEIASSLLMAYMRIKLSWWSAGHFFKFFDQVSINIKLYFFFYLIISVLMLVLLLNVIIWRKKNLHIIASSLCLIAWLAIGAFAIYTIADIFSNGWSFDDIILTFPYFFGDTLKSPAFCTLYSAWWITVFCSEGGFFVSNILQIIALLLCMFKINSQIKTNEQRPTISEESLRDREMI